MRVREPQTDNDTPRGWFDECTRTFMSWRLTITIWRQRLSDEYVKYRWHIHYESNSGYTFDWDIPADIGEVAKNLWYHIDIEAAKIIYNNIIDRYNDVFVGFQNERNLITEWYVGHNRAEVISFPPFEYFEDEIRRIRRSYDLLTSTRTHDDLFTPYTYDDYPTLTDSNYQIWASYSCNWICDGIRYITDEEYERMKESGELQKDAAYLVINSN